MLESDCCFDGRITWLRFNLGLIIRFVFEKCRRKEVKKYYNGGLELSRQFDCLMKNKFFGQTTIIIVHSAIMPTFKSLSLRSQPFYLCTKKNAVS